MKIVILDKNVRRNIELFRQLVHRQGQKREVLIENIKKGYKAYLNCQTGELRFTRPKGHEEWKSVILLLHPGKEGAFEVASEGKNPAFDL